MGGNFNPFGLPFRAPLYSPGEFSKKCFDGHEKSLEDGPFSIRPLSEKIEINMEK
jgi:hypothetical protein